MKHRCYTELLFLHPVGSAGHVVQSGGVWGANRRRTIFHAEWDRYGFDKKQFRRRYAKLVFLHPVGSAGHVVHSDASEA
jgi:hypothetical protein